MGIGEIGLGVLGEIAPQGADALALDADDLDAGVGKAVRNREPAHPCRLHQGLNRPSGRHALGRLRDKRIKRSGVVPEADRLADVAPVVEDWPTWSPRMARSMPMVRLVMACSLA